MPVWINYVEGMAKFVNIPVHTCLESTTSRILHESEFQYWYTGGAGGGGGTGSPGASTYRLLLLLHLSD